MKQAYSIAIGRRAPSAWALACPPSNIDYLRRFGRYRLYPSLKQIVSTTVSFIWHGY